MGGKYHVVLVVYVYMQFNDSAFDGWFWKNDVEASAKNNKWSVWVSHVPLYEKY
jgi:hypothetical protein